MYKVKLWDEDKWDIHSSSYSSSKHENIFSDNKKYNEQKYGPKEKDAASDYMKKEEEREKEDKKNIIEGFEEEKKEQEIKEEEIPLKAAKQIFSERSSAKKIENKKGIKTIEDAIRKAIEEEKKVIVMDS